MNAPRLTITTPSDREVAMTRVFDAPRALVFDAFTKPALIQRWLGVFGGWTLPVCTVDLRVGGKTRYVWKGPDGTQMGHSSVFVEVNPPERLVVDESFDDAWYEGNARVTTTFTEKAGKTMVVMTVRYDNTAVRDAVLKSPMSMGVGAGFDTLASILPTLG